MKFVTLRNGAIIAVHKQHVQGKDTVGIYGHNLSDSPFLRIKCYNNDELSGEEANPEDAKAKLKTRMDNNFYQGEHTSSKNSTPARTKNTLQQICGALGVEYQPQAKKEPKQAKAEA